MAERVIGKGDVYKNKETKEEVVVFYTDRSKVRYAPIGSSHEDEDDFQGFQDKHTYVKTVDIG